MDSWHSTFGSIAGMRISTRPLVHGELEMVLASWKPCMLAQVVPGMCRPSMVKLGALGAKIRHGKNFTQHVNTNKDTDVEATAGASRIPFSAK